MGDSLTRAVKASQKTKDRVAVRLGPGTRGEDPGCRRVAPSLGRRCAGWRWVAGPTPYSTFSKCWSSKEILAVPDWRTPEP